MTRYLRKCRIVGLAGLVSLAVFAFSAAPAGATLVCPHGKTNPKYCTHKITLSVTITISSNLAVTVTIKVTDPHVTVTLLHNGKVVERIFDGNETGTFHLKFKEPTKPGTYVLKVVASVDGVSKTVTKTIKVEAPK